MQEEIQAHLLGRAYELPAPVPFRNYVAQARLGTTVEEHDAFFRRMLGDVDEPTAPFGLLEVQGDGSGVEVGYVDVDPAVSRRLRGQARRLGVSAAALCHLAWAQVLARVSGRSDVVFGTVLLGRLQGFEGAELGMGLFMNTLPLRVQVGEESVEAAVRNTHVLLAELLRHEHASLVLAQRCSRIPAPLPLFSALLNYRHNVAASTESAHAWDGIEAVYGEERTNYPLVLSIDDLNDGFGLTVHVRSGIGALRVCRFVHTALERLAYALEHTPHAALRSVDVLPSAERDQLIEEWNATAQEFPAEACVHELFEAQVEKTPDAVAVIDEVRTVTYGELNVEANQLAHYLRTLGVGPGKRVALCVERSVEMVAGLLAVLKAGGAYVPLDPTYPAERLQQMVADSDPVVVLTQEKLADASSWADRPRTNPARAATGLTSRDVAYVIYTSGSTGIPKGVMNEHRGVVNRLVWMQDAFNLTANDAVLQKTPYSFDVSVWEFFWPLQNGARLVMARPEGHKDPRYLSEIIERERITTMHFVPSMLQVFLDHGDAAACTSLKRVVCSGEALPATLVSRFHEKLPHVALSNLYGPTEAAVDVTWWECVPGGSGTSVPIGRPVANTRMYILDGHGQPVPIGVPGEIHIGGVQVARGYLNRPELTAEKFVRDPFSRDVDARIYRTGDLGRYLPDGNIEYLGRNDHQVKLRGFRIELGEIEAHLLEQVKEAVVLAREDRLVAYVVADDVDVEQLRRHLSSKLPEYMVPAAYVRLEALPLTPNGKVDRKALPAPEGKAYGARTYEAPRGEVEGTIARIWAELLRVERVGRHDNFFELGGHSLLAVALMERMRRAGLSADVRSVFTSPTPAGLAAALGAGTEDVEVPPNAIPAGCAAITPDLLPLVELNAEEIERIVSQVPGGAANVQDIYRLAPLQEGILFHHLMAKERDPYLLISELRFDSRERLDKYLSALQSVVNRHDILRTGVLWEGLSVPVQVVVRSAALPIEEVRLDPRAARIDVRQAPMLRVSIAPENESGRWVLSLLLHHLAGDHTTLEIVEQEIEAHLLGRSEELPPPLPFRNFVAQARLGISETEHEAFFRRMLGDVEEPTAPFGLLEVQGEGREVEEAHVAVDAALNGRLRERARRLGVSAASLCHVAWAQVLARICGREDVVFGTVLFGRMHGGAAADRVMGLFINTLPVRIAVGGESAEAAVHRTHTLLAELLRHEHAPLALAQRCSAVAPPAPLFTTLFNYRHLAGSAPSAESRRAWEGIESLYGEERTNYPLLLSVDDDGETLRLSVQVEASIGATRICRFMHTALERLIEALEKAPRAAMATIDVLPPEERALLIDGFNDTATRFPGDACLHESFEAQVRKTPHATAATFGDREITYDELNARANQLAHYLRELGVGPDRRVALCVPRGIELLVGMLAVLKAGGAYVPLDPAYPAERLRSMLSDSEPIVLLTERALEPILGASVPALDLTGDASLWASHPRTNPDRAAIALRPDHLAYVLYTSGSTGRPKGVMLEHRNAVNFVRWAQSAFSGELLGRTLFSTSLNFDLAVFESFVPLSIGGTVCIATDVLALAQKPVDVTLINTVPSAMTALVEAGGVPATVRRVNLAGEPLREILVRRIFAATHADAVSNLYGPTETTTYSTWVTMHRGEAFASHVGRPIANTRIYLLDPQGRPAPIGVAGEIHIGGAGVARGYLNRPELTAEKFIDDPFAKGRMYRTGDLGRYLPDGNIEYLGRNDHQVKIRGFRIELGEIEARLLEQVKEAVVLAREDRLVAYVVGDAEADELRNYLGARLPEYMVPAAYVRLEALPLTPNGKVDRKALPAPEGQAYGARVYEAPQGEVEETISRIWAELLRVERVGRHDNFFELGGHSLLAVTLMERMRRAGLSADVRSVFTSPTPAGLAAALGAGAEDVEVPPNLIPAGCEAITPDMLPLVELTAEEIERIVSQVRGGAPNIQDIYRLAPLQEGILFHHLMAKEGDPYLLASALRFDNRGRLDEYLSALQAVVDRHDILRTGVLWEGLSVPVQVVVRKATLPVEEVDAELDLRTVRIDVRQAPMLRVHVAQEDGRWVLTSLLHHLAGDHTTLEIVQQEIEAQLLGRSEELPPPLPFRNFVAQARLGVGEKEHEAFFRGMLGDVDEPTAPFGLLEVQGDGSGVGEAHVAIDAALNERLRERARRLGVSAASLCHVAWAQVLARICGREDVVFGTVLFGRMHGGAAADRVMGLFMNTLPVRIHVGSESVETAVRRTHTLLAELLRHEHAPLALAQRCSAVTAPMPLFSALLNYRHTRPFREAAPDDGRNAWDGIEGLYSTERTNYPVMLAVDDFGDGFELTAQTADSIEPMRVCRFMATALEQLVSALERDSDAALCSLDVLPPAERSRVLQEWNDTRADFPDQACIHELFEAAAEATPDATALTFGRSVLTYRELNERANQLAHHLRDLGVGPGTRTAICVDRGIEMVVGVLAVLKAGGAYVPLDPAYPAERIALVLEDCEPVALLTESSWNADAHLWAQRPKTNPDRSVTGTTSRDLAYVIYTSGSSGRPKGVMNTHRGVVNLLWSMRKALDVDASDNVVALTTLAFDIAALELYLPLVSGARMTLLDRATSTNAEALAATLEESGATVVQATPSTWRMLVEAGWGGVAHLKALCGGEALPAALAERIRERVAALWNVYGPTETTIWSAIERVGDTTATVVPIGRPLANTSIYVLDSHGRPAPVGVAGEIHIGGEGVARGYFRRPDLTAEKFLDDPFSAVPEARLYATGDLGRLLPDGRIEFLGRNDFQIKLRGYRIEPGEIEARLTEHPAIREAAVMAREDVAGDKRLVAYVVSVLDGASLDREELRRHVAARLPDYMIPAAFVQLDSLPLTPNGKLDRKALPAPDADAHVSRLHEPPRGELETLVGDVWSGVLDVARVSRTDNFFELGGHSLLAVQVISRLRQALGIDAAVHTLFEFPRLSDFARELMVAEQSSLPPIAPAPAGDRQALSFEQQPLWLVSQLDGRSAAYHIRLRLRLGGALDRDALRRALDALVARHEALRTTFDRIDGEPVQRIAPEGEARFVLREHDLAEDELEQLAAEEATAPFDLERGPLIRGRLIRVAEEDHTLLLTMHHIVSDGWSASVIVREVSALYAAFRDGAANPLPPLPVQYADYAAWQRRWLGGEHLRPQEQYWRATLEGAPALLEFPADRPRPSRQDYRGAAVEVVLDADLTRRLRALSRRNGSTLFMTLMAGWAALLSRMAGQSEVMIGTPTANRGRVETEGLVGFFVNTLALRVDLSGAPAVGELRRRVREQVLAAQQNQDVPFERVVELAGVARSAAYTPLFQVLFAWESAAAEMSAFGDLALLPVPYQNEGPVAAKFDLSLSLNDAGDVIAGSLEYATALFERSTIDRMLGYWRTLLEAMVREDGRIVEQLPLLEAAERIRLLDDWNATEADFPAEHCIHELFEARVDETPDAIALVHESIELTYEELNERANRLAHFLRRLGVTPDTRVAICTQRGIEMIVGLLAVLKAGGAYVPLDPAYPDERLRATIEDSAAALVLTDGVLEERVAVYGAAPVIDLTVLEPALLSEPRTNPDPAAVGLLPGHLAYVIYTSGSTGRPKGVMIEHRGLCNLVTAQIAGFGVEAESRVLQFASFSFDACVSEVMMALCCGATLVLPPQKILAGETLVEVVDRHRITHVTLPPAVLAAMPDELTMPSLRTLIVAGEALPQAVARLWATRVRLINAYGPTETTVCATMGDCDPLDAGNPPIGRPIANTRVYILDPHGEPVPIGVTGEIHVGGAGVARGYLNRPELTAERFVRDPFHAEPEMRMYRTGDLGRYLPDGRIEFLGRNDFQVKVRGFRIEPGEIEAHLLERVKEAVVLAREGRLVAYFVGDAGAEELRSSLAARLPEYMVPAAYVRLESLPLTPNGKLDRQALPAPDGAELSAAYEAPQNELETLVTAVWAEVLERDRIGRLDDFFEAGGDSLLAVQVVWRLRQALNVEIALDGLFTHPVLADFTRELAKTREAALPAITRAAESERTVPSFAQQRLWFLAQLDDASAAYHIPFGLRLKGALDVVALRRALDRLVERHEVLRTTFVSVDGQPRLRIAGAAQSRFHLVEHDCRPAEAPERELEILSEQEARAPFDLRHGPMIRGRLVRLGEQEHALLITQHHIVSDGWSMGVLLGELAALYKAYCGGNSDPLPTLELQYADYAAWQRRTMAGEALQRQADYWRTALAGAPALLELPADHPRPAQQRYEGDLIECGLDPELTAKVRALAKRHGATLFMTLLASWAALLSRLSGQGDVVIGTPTANRGRAETEGLIGFFVNTLALRFDLSDSPSVGELLSRVKSQSLAAQQNQDIPFEQVVDLVRPARSLAHSPLFQVMFSWDNAPGGIPEFEALTIGRGPGSKHVTAKFDLTVWMAETGDTISGGIEYATSLFDRSTVERFLGHWRTLLEAMVEHDALTVARLPLLSEGERHHLVEEWNATAQEFPAGACIHELFEAQGEKTPDAVAVIDEVRTVTYRELNAEANQLAHYLRTLGVGPDRRVALCMERSVEMVVGLLAVLKAGGAYVPLDPWYPAARLQQMLADCDPVAVLTQEKLLSVVTGTGDGRPVLDLSSPAPVWANQPRTNPASGVGPRDVAYVIYTSGSTGMPKGVMNEHRGVVNRLVWMQDAFGLTARDTVLQKTPYSFDVSVWEFFWPLQNGARLVMARPEGHKDPRYLSEIIERERITTLHFVPSMLQAFLEHGDAAACTGLKRVVCSGEALPATLVNRFHEKLPHVALSNLYGPTEAAVDVTWWECVPGGTGTTVPIGRPVANTRMYILDGQNQPVPIGVAGEIHIGGVQVARGYLNRPELTAEKFVRDPFVGDEGRMYRTGDLGRYLPDGNIEYLGRNDHQVKLRGFRIELGEIEAHLLEQVKEAVVLAREDRLVAYVVADDVDVEQLRRHLSSKLPEYMVPAAYVRLEALPLTPNGKVDRKALPAPEGNAYGARVYEAPQGEVEGTVARIWAELLRVERVGRHDNFFELGGHSLLAVTLMERMRQQGLEADVRAVFTTPTPAGLAAATQEIEEIRL